MDAYLPQTKHCSQVLCVHCKIDKGIREHQQQSIHVYISWVVVHRYTSNQKKVKMLQSLTDTCVVSMGCHLLLIQTEPVLQETNIRQEINSKTQSQDIQTI